jgi:hypothetical protein
MFLVTKIVLVSGMLAGISVLFHYECLCFLDRIVDRFGSHRRRLLATMTGLLLAHIAEIWIYAGAYVLLYDASGFGTIQTVPAGSIVPLDFVYYSAMVYTTVGFGDMVPTGGFRLITATEALIGLSLITWSASFTYFQMQAMFGRRSS